MNCPRCRTFISDKFNYCPHCGAEMVDWKSRALTAEQRVAKLEHSLEQIGKLMDQSTVYTEKMLQTARRVDFANVAYNLHSIGYKEGTFSPSNLDGSFDYVCVENGMYVFSDHYTKAHVCTVFPKAAEGSKK